jgi:hypothetical protein
LKQLQHNEWLQYNPLQDWPYNGIMRRHYRTYLAIMISLCKEYDITFDINSSECNTIMDRNILIRNLLTEFDKFKGQLKGRNIMFLEQLTSVNGQQLSTWHTITKRSFTNHLRKSQVPKWFKLIESIVIFQTVPIGHYNLSLFLDLVHI